MNFTIKDARIDDLNSIAKCHLSAFRQSVATLLGLSFTKKMLQWYLSAPNKFLFWIEENDECIGYCGGYLMDGSDAHGSASGMTQFGFVTAVKLMLRKPWLIFHPEIRARYPFIIRNIKTYFKPKATTPKLEFSNKKNHKNMTLIAGLVVIGVKPSLHKKGIGSALQQEFESRAKSMGAQQLQLSVRKKNTSAIASYERNGWQIESEGSISYVMNKIIV